MTLQAAMSRLPDIQKPLLEHLLLFPGQNREAGHVRKRIQSKVRDSRFRILSGPSGQIRFSPKPNRPKTSRFGAAPQIALVPPPASPIWLAGGLLDNGR